MMQFTLSLEVRVNNVITFPKLRRAGLERVSSLAALTLK